MENKDPLAKWEGKVSKRLAKATVDQIWPLYADFFNLHKWFPGLETCYGIHGNNGELGCIRFCGISPGNADKPEPANWAKERLIAIDHAQHTLSYDVVDTTIIGLRSFVGTVKILPSGDDDDRTRGGVIEWSFTVDPIDGWSLDGVVAQFD
ncbi:Polyketide cyclase/dehydrase [Parasponia andersonii]|uniref:Polyketide cyclase/dehydrase n=1 Tax=Parasponia andersonii TaxID=3476 RepID=A0A2P5D3J0_PARAD|nr:Polyketide cyclase/dehydrase [Parasponia andersonii]